MGHLNIFIPVNLTFYNWWSHYVSLIFIFFSFYWKLAGEKAGGILQFTLACLYQSVPGP